MRQPPTRYLGIDLNLQARAIEPQVTPVPQFIIFLDPQGRYHFGRGIDELKRAIISQSLEPDLESANRHLWFDLKVIRGTRTDAYLDALNRDEPRPRRRHTNRDRYF